MGAGTLDAWDLLLCKHEEAGRDARGMARSASSTECVPASWQPDPTGRHIFRYWDGVAWSEWVSDHGQVEVDHVDTYRLVPPREVSRSTDSSQRGRYHPILALTSGISAIALEAIAVGLMSVDISSSSSNDDLRAILPGPLFMLGMVLFLLAFCVGIVAIGLGIIDLRYSSKTMPKWRDRLAVTLGVVACLVPVVLMIIASRAS